jgi:hypothetical protein
MGLAHVIRHGAGPALLLVASKFDALAPSTTHGRRAGRRWMRRVGGRARTGSREAGIVAEDGFADAGLGRDGESGRSRALEWCSSRTRRSTGEV